MFSNGRPLVAKSKWFLFCKLDFLKSDSSRNIKVASLKPMTVQEGQRRMVTYLAGRLGRDGASKVRVFFVISFAYIIFWGPLFAVTLFNWSWEWNDAKNSLSHEVRATYRGHHVTSFQIS